MTIEDTFDIIKRAHLSTGHGGRDRMIKELQKKYANITIKSIELFKYLCEECQKKRKRPMTKGVVVRPILSKEFSSRVQVDLIDIQSMAHMNCKWIMVYQDHLTKFCVLRPLTYKRAAEVAYQLVDVFLLFGASTILQSDNGSEFTANIITELKQLWPDMKLVHGKHLTHRVKDQWSVLTVTARTCWLHGCPTIIPKTGLLESSLFSFKIILPIIQGSSVHRIQPCLEVRRELDLHLHHYQMN